MPRSARSLLIAGIAALIAAVALEAAAGPLQHLIVYQLDGFSQRALSTAMTIFGSTRQLLWSLSAVLIGGAFIVWAVVRELAPTNERAHS